MSTASSPVLIDDSAGLGPGALDGARAVGRAIRWTLVGFVLMIALPHTSAWGQIHWQPSLESAQRVAAQSRRLVLIHFWAPWCKPCMRLEQQVFSVPQVGGALEANFVLVKLNVDDSPATAKIYGVSALPSDVIVTATGQLVTTMQSPSTSEQYVLQMNRAADVHKQLAQAPASGFVRSTSQPQQADPHAGAASASGNPAGTYSGLPLGNGAAVPGGAAGAPGAALPAGAPLAPSATPQDAAATAGAAPPQYDIPSQGTAPSVEPPAITESSVPAESAVPRHQLGALPAGSPQLALDGYCPVTLIEQHRWAEGDKRWGAVHRGRTFLFASAEAQRRFLANPDGFSPVINGNDPVLALDSRQSVPGKRAHGLFFEQRIYLFSSEDSLKRFAQNPQRYAAEVLQAMR